MAGIIIGSACLGMAAAGAVQGDPVQAGAGVFFGVWNIAHAFFESRP